MRPRDSKVDYRSLFNQMFDGLAYCRIVLDGQGNPVDFVYLAVNQNFEQLTGLKDVTGRRVTEVIPGIQGSNPEIIEAYGRVALTRIPEKIDTYLPTLAKWFSVSVYSPRKRYFVTAFQNSTEQKQAEERWLRDTRIATENLLEDLQVEKKTLAHEKARSEAMLASIGDGVIIVDVDQRITFMNLAAENLLGWKNVEATGKPMSDIVPVEDEQGTLLSEQTRPMASVLAGAAAVAEPKAVSRIYYYVRKDKTSFPVSMTFSSVVLDKKIIGGIEVFHNVTREKEIDKAKSEFVSLASHQLKTPPRPSSCSPRGCWRAASVPSPTSSASTSATYGLPTSA